MINTNHLFKVSAAWVSIVYVVCFAGVALFPSIRQLFILYTLHMDVSSVSVQSVVTVGTFISGLIIWNIIATLAVWLFAALYNGIKQ